MSDDDRMSDDRKSDDRKSDDEHGAERATSEHDATVAPRARANDRREGLAGPTPEERPTPRGKRNSQGIRIDPEVEAEREPRRAVISVLVTHEPGVLSEVSSLFSRRQFNIESLTVGATNDPERARITVVVEEPDPGVDQIEKQLRKLIPVISVRELEPDAIRRELAIVKVDAESPSEVAAVADMYDARTVDASPATVTVRSRAPGRRSRARSTPSSSSASARSREPGRPRRRAARSRRRERRRRPRPGEPRRRRPRPTAANPPTTRTDRATKRPRTARRRSTSRAG